MLFRKLLNGAAMSEMKISNSFAYCIDLHLHKIKKKDTSFEVSDQTDLFLKRLEIIQQSGI